MKLSEIQIIDNPVIKPSEMKKISCSKDAAELFRRIWKTSIQHKESFYVLYLNRNNKVLGYHLVSIGGVSGTVVDPKCIFQVALKAHASCLIVAHNHPSGNTAPSSQDLTATKKLKEGGQLLDLQLLDHIILLPVGYVSLVEEGYL